MWKRNLLLNKILCVSICLSFCVFLICGCANTTKEISDNTKVITFKDALDRDIMVSKNPRRVAALIGSFAEVWQLAGGNICASAEDAWDDFGLTLDNAINIGGAHSPNVERLISSEPDFVIASASTASNVKMLEVLEKAGITVAYFDVDCFDEYLKMLRICTQITGRDDLYIKHGINIQEQIENIKFDFAKKDIPKEQKTVLLLRTSSSTIKAKGSKGTVLGEMLKDMGCINIADNDKGLLENLNIESIAKSEPYRIFVVTMGDEKAATKNFQKVIEENPLWSKLSAVKNDRCHVMDRKLFNLKPNSRWAEAYEKLQEILQ